MFHILYIFAHFSAHIAADIVLFSPFFDKKKPSTCGGRLFVA